MGYTLEEFAAACHRILAAEPGASGREKVCALVQTVLKDEAFLAAHLAEDGPERRILYEDPELGFCILAHVYQGAKESAPHDHGPSWAIYGQARGETIMNDWALVEQAVEDKQAALQDPAIVSDGARLHSASVELDEARKTVDQLYARWAELEEKSV